MQLKEIKDEKCPYCGGRATREEQSSQHCNGHWNEQRAFECGLSLSFSPNFMRISESGMCERTDAYKERQKKRKEALSSIKYFVNGLDLDDCFKLEILTKIGYCFIE